MEQRDAIQEIGGDLVVFYNAPHKMVEAWRRDTSELPDDLMVVSDPTATVFEALGTRRARNYLALARGSTGPALRSLREGRLPKATRADMLRLGADVAVRDDGTIAKLHLADSPDDRLPVPDLVGALT